MAWAASLAASLELDSSGTSLRTPSCIFSMGSCFPNDACGSYQYRALGDVQFFRRYLCRFVAVGISLFSPVQALATPLLQTMAWAVSPSYTIS